MATKTAYREIGRALDEPVMTFDLGNLVQQLKNEETWEQEDRNAMILLKGHGLRVALVVMHAGTTIDSHKAECPLSLQVLEGNLKFATDLKTVMLGKGQMLSLQTGIRHEMEAVGETAFLLTLATGEHPAAI